MQLEIIIGGTEYAPASKSDRRLWVQLQGENAGKMNDLFQRFFGLNGHDRYMGSFPYPDKDTGVCRVTWCLSMRSHDTRNAIVACLRAVVSAGGLSDITILKEDRARNNNNPWPACMEIVAMGPSITDNLVGEERIQAALELLETWFASDALRS